MVDHALIPTRLLKKIEKFIDEAQDDWLNEADAAKYLGISKRSLQNLVYSKAIPLSDYTISTVTGKRMFKKSKLVKPH